MTKKQRHIVKGWIATAVIGVTAVALEPWISEQWKWVQFVLLGAMAMASLWDRPNDRGIPRIAIGEALELYPLVKIWYAVCGLLIAVVVVVATHSKFRLDERIGNRGLFVVLGVLLAPMIFVIERERFKAAGESGSNAI